MQVKMDSYSRDGGNLPAFALKEGNSHSKYLSAISIDIRIAFLGFNKRYVKRSFSKMPTL